MGRVKTTVYNGNRGEVRVVENTIRVDLDRGVISIDGGRFSYIFSPDAWSHIMQEVIED